MGPGWYLRDGKKRGRGGPEMKNRRLYLRDETNQGVGCILKLEIRRKACTRGRGRRVIY